MSDEERIAPGRVRIGVGALIVGILAAIAVTVTVGMLRGADAGAEEVPDPTPAPTASSAGLLYIHVSGAVRIPGLYRLPVASRVLDAIAAAGGFSDDADEAAVNLARPVTDGEQLHLAREGEQVEDADVADGVAGGRVNINTADPAALETLPGIGPALAGRIVAWREENGPFGSPDDLLAVAGIGDQVLAGVRDLVGV